MSKLTQALKRIFDCINKQRIALLQPGLSDDRIEEIVRDLPFQLPKEVCELYKWKNGWDDSNEIYDIYNNCYIFPADELYSFYPLQTVVKNAIDCYIFCGKWEHLNIFFSMSMAEKSGSVLLDPNPNKSRVVFYHQGEYWDRTYQYTSLTNMMMTIAECYETRAYSYTISRDLGNKNLATTKIWWKYNSDITDILLEELQNPTSEIWQSYEMARQLIQFKDTLLIESLIKAFQRSLSGNANNQKNMIIRDIAAQILGEMGDVRAVEPLIAALQLNEYLTNHYAAQALSMLKDDRAIEPLINIFINLVTEEAPGGSGLSAVVNALIDLKAVDALIETLNHNDSEVREIAAIALGEIKDTRAIEPLSRLLKDAYSSVRETVTKVLDKMGDIDNAEPQLMPQNYCISPISPVSPIKPIGPIDPIDPIDPISP